MRKSIIIGLHATYWFCVVFFSLIVLAGICQSQPEGTSPVFYLTFGFGFLILPAAVSYYSFYKIFFPKYLQHEKHPQVILYGLLFALGSGIAGASFIILILREDAIITDSLFCLIMATLIMSFIGLINGTIALILKGFFTWFEEVKLKEALKEKNHQMELALVKSQLDPHFLFNTINNIDVLILKNAELASDYLNKLSDIMRFMLFETKTSEILLSKEIEYIDKYIKLQKIRTANSHYVNYSVIGDSAEKKIAPMIFIPFIENAFKHTNNKKIEDAITVNILIENDSVKLECINKFDPNRLSKTEDHGLGNDLIQKRLNLIYPKQHVLKIKQETDLYSVFLTIKTHHEKI